MGITELHYQFSQRAGAAEGCDLSEARRAERAQLRTPLQAARGAESPW